jgi:uncharacterized protein YllA (UPF0747 family)
MTEDEFFEQPRIINLIDKNYRARQHNLKFLRKRMIEEAKNKDDCLTLLSEIIQ